MNDLLVGYKLDRFDILNKIGQGSLGTVYQARDPELNRTVAIKVCHPFFARQPDFQKRFQQEARIGVLVDHPGLIKVYDIGISNAFYYIVEEFITGGSLRMKMDRILSARKLMPLPEVLLLVSDAARSIQYAHDQGIIHRDISPNNILIRLTPWDKLPYRPVISDLGLAKLTGGLETQGTGVHSASVSYISPEQAFGQPVTRSTDIYSLGVILYELCTGELPLKFSSINEAKHKFAHEEIPMPRSIRTEIPKRLEAVIMKALEKSPQKRYASAEQFATALRDVPLPVRQVEAQPVDVGGDRTAIGPDSLEIDTDGTVISEPPSVTRDYVLVESPTRGREYFALKEYGLMCGRAPNCDILLDDADTDYHHAKIELVNNEYIVTDLGSSSGTFMNEVKLLPMNREGWQEDVVLRIGQTRMWLKLKPELPPPGEEEPLPGDEWIHRPIETAEVILDNPVISLAVGESATIKILVKNISPRVEQYKIIIDGLDKTWIVTPLKDAQLNPDAHVEIPVLVRVPQKPDNLAKTHSFAVLVESRIYPGRVARAEGTLTVGPFFQFSADLNPEEAEPHEIVNLAITNRGNAADIYEAVFESPSNELKFNPPKNTIRIQPGKTGVMKFTVAPNKLRLIGGKQAHMYKTEVKSTSGTETLMFQGALIDKGIVPVWVLALLLFLAVVIAAVILVLALRALLPMLQKLPRGLGWMELRNLAYLIFPGI